MSNEHLGKLQLAIMRVLWAQGEGTVTDVQRALEESHGLALTTIATMLKKMEAKGVVEHRTDGRRFVYRPRVSEHRVTRQMVADLADKLFDGSAVALVSHLLDAHEVDPDELAELRKRIDEAAKQSAPSGSGQSPRPSGPARERKR